MRILIVFIHFFIALQFLFPSCGYGQFLESGSDGEPRARAVAGVLGGHFGESKEYVFLCMEKILLVAAIEGDLFQYRGRGEHDAEHVDAETEGGCAGGGGPPGFLIEVFADDAEEPFCFAERPRYPGWMRDPRLACMLNGTGEQPMRYRLRVTLTSHDHGEEVAQSVSGPGQTYRPYVLNMRAFEME